VGQTADEPYDMTDVLAYQIGAVFFLVVLFMVGTMTRGLFSADLFKNIKLTVFVVVALLVGFFVYHDLPDLSSYLNFDFNKPAGTAQAPEPAPAPAPVTPAVAVKRASAPRPAVKMGEVRIIQPADPEPEVAVQPAAVVVPPSPVSQPSVIAETRALPAKEVVAPESGNRVKKAINSVGHFLHLGHKQYQPGQSVPQDESAPQH
jgi:hypothetical protein